MTHINTQRLPVVLAFIAAGLAGAALVAWLSGMTMTVIGGCIVGSWVMLALAVTASAAWRSLIFTAWVLAAIMTAMLFPPLVTDWGGFKLQTTIGPLVQLIMFGMGITLTFDDFRRVARQPAKIGLAAALQFSIMPLAAFLFAGLFGLEGQVAAGLILIGSCPGGTSSNVLTYIARGNVPLSVTMTAVSTILAPVMTPVMMKLYAGQFVPVEMWPMMVSIVKIIIVPVIVGILINRYLPKVATWASRVLPGVAMASICIIIAVTIGLARDDLLVVGLALLFASICHNAIGFVLGYYGAKMVGMNRRDCRTVAIEVGLQNGGMATGLALTVMNSPLAALGSAVFGPWSAVSSSILASIWRRSAAEDDLLDEQAVATARTMAAQAPGPQAGFPLQTTSKEPA